MSTFIVLCSSSVLAALLYLFPTDAPPYAWWGVLICFVSVPVLFWLENAIYVFGKDFDAITGREHVGHFDHNDYH